MSIRFGVSPIAWINDDMPELGGDTSLEQVLAEARDIGFAGIELGGRFPRDPADTCRRCSPASNLSWWEGGTAPAC